MANNNQGFDQEIGQGTIWILQGFRQSREAVDFIFQIYLVLLSVDKFHCTQSAILQSNQQIELFAIAGGR